MTSVRAVARTALVLLTLGQAWGPAHGQAQVADLILHNGKIVTVDREFSIRQALAVKGDRLILVGTDEEVMKSRGRDHEVVDLGGKMVLPGLIDSHIHPTGACMTEFDHPIPEMETIAGRARLHPEAGADPGRGRVDRGAAGLHHSAEGAALSRPARSWTGSPRRIRSLFSTGPTLRSTRWP